MSFLSLLGLGNAVASIASAARNYSNSNSSASKPTYSNPSTSSSSSLGKKTVTVVPGSVEESILKAQYGNNINYQYGNANQFAGADRNATNQLYQNYLKGLTPANIGNLDNYAGIPIVGGAASKDYAGIVSNMVNTTNDINQYKMDTQKAIETQKAQTDALLAQQEAARLGQIGAAKNNAISSLNMGRGDVENNYTNAQGVLNQQKNQAGGQFATMRNNAQVQAVQNSQKLKEIMAAQGLFNSGSNITGQLQVDTAKQNAFNQINSDEQSQYADISRRLDEIARTKAQEIAKINQQITGVNSSSSAEEAAALADIGSQRTKAQMDLANAQSQANQYALTMTQNANKDWLSNLWQQKQLDQTNADNAKKWDYQMARDAVADQQWADEFGLKKYSTYNTKSSSSSGMDAATKDFYQTQGYNSIVSAFDNGATLGQVTSNIANDPSVPQSLRKTFLDYADMYYNATHTKDSDSGTYLPNVNFAPVSGASQKALLENIWANIRHG